MRSDPASHAASDPARLSLTAGAGDVPASALDYAQTLQRVADLAVATLGDLCIVDVVEGGELQRVATAHVNEHKVKLAQTLRERYPPRRGSPQPAARVWESGQRELLEHVTPEVLAAHALDDVHAQLIRDLGVRSHLAVPLVARGTTVGVINLGITESDRTYGPADVALAEDLARLAALAIDNARLYGVAQREISERRRVEDASRLTGERFEAVMDQSPLSTQILAPSGKTLRVNAAWEQLWGLSLGDVADYNMLRDPQLDAHGITPLLRRAFAGEAVSLPTVRYDPNLASPDRSRHADPVRWVRAFAYPVRDASGTVREVVLVHEDVTDAHRGEERLRSSEGRLRLALAAGQMNAWDWDLENDVVQCSENAVAFWGVDVGSSADFMAVIHPDDLATVEEAGRAAMAGGDDYSAEYRLRSATGVRWVQSRGRVERHPDGRAARIFGVTVDITSLKEAEQTTRLLADAGDTLGASLDYHTTLRNLAHLVVPRFADWFAVDMVADDDTLERVSVHHPDATRVALANELFERYPPRRDDPSGIWRVIDTGQPEWAAEIDDDMLRAGARDARHLALLRELDLRSYIAVPMIARGATIGVLTLVQAESRRRYKATDVALAMDLARRAAAAVDNARLYEQLRTADRRKDEFLATLAHELRNPLAPIRTGLAVLRSAPDAEAAERTRQVMERQLAHMVHLIDDLLDLSRVTRGQVHLDRQRVDLGAIVGSALESSVTLLEAAGLELVVKAPDAPIALEADRVRLSQVVSNLLSNAAKFTPRGGRVDLEVIDEGADAVVRVTDSGIGIPPPMLTNIFEMFVQVGDDMARNEGGLGIGLTLVRRLVELHGGEAWAESAGRDQGSRFSIRLPKAPAGVPPPVPEDGTTLVVAAPGPRRVLVVDDNLDAADMLATLLEFDGHEVRTAADGPSALATVREFAPDIVFLDIGLPGMNGYELAMHLRQAPGLATVTLVAVTGWGQDEDRRQSITAGIDHHLTKPVEPDAVRAMVAAPDVSPLPAPVRAERPH